MKNEKLPITVIITSLLLGFYIDIKCINWALVYGFFNGLDRGFLPLLYSSVFILIILNVGISKYKKKIDLKNYSLFLIFYLLVFFFLTMNFIGPPKISFLHFLTLVIIGLIIPNIILVNTRLVLKSIMFYPIFSVLKLDSVFSPSSDWISAISMDASYAFITPVMAMFIYLIFFFKQETKKQKISTIILSAINLIFLFKLVQYGSRGPILSLLLVLGFLWIVRPRYENIGILINKKRLAVSFLSIIILFFFFQPIITYLSSVLESNNLYFYGLGKTINLLEHNNISNGRNLFNSISLNMFADKPFIGYGLDRFDANTGLGYPHNFVLQTLVDGGILLFIILLVPIIFNLIKKYKRCNKDEFVLMTFLFFSSVPYALLSQNMWNNSGLWLFFGTVLSSSLVFRKS
ncbi:MAG: O-antigen ligase family protein [Tissierellia bacterium]|nr:O-antigen ligase family protein [Tissierellia bacterium]